uniref:FBP1 n=1 Tax=Zanthoxylum armatum TaxID=67938 RepID=A0A9E9G0M1_9ROSI|nr:FBP1 [Zanthoxylum armatum]
MGRGKIEIKRIENLNNRQVTYSKRKNGLIKKTKEIAVLCDAKAVVIIVPLSGKIHEYCSAPLADILDQYHRETRKRLWDPHHETLSNEIERIKRENDSMQIKLRQLKGEDITPLKPKELICLEDALANGLAGVRDKQTEKIDGMRENGKMMEEEHNYLKFILRQQEIAMQQQHMTMENNTREIENGYHQQRENHEYNLHMPLTFNMQPI